MNGRHHVLRAMLHKKKKNLHLFWVNPSIDLGFLEEENNIWTNTFARSKNSLKFGKNVASIAKRLTKSETITTLNDLRMKQKKVV